MGAQIGFIFICIIFTINADWVEIPQSKPFSESTTTSTTKTSGSTLVSESKTPVHIVFNSEQIENVESFNSSSTIINKRVTPADAFKLDSNIPRKNRITIKPAKSYIMEVFSSTTQFTPLMSSISDAVNLSTTESPEIPIKLSTTTSASIKPTVLAKTTTTPTPRKPAKAKNVVVPTKTTNIPRTPSYNENRNKTKNNLKLNNHSDGIEIEEAPNDGEILENREIPDVGSFSSYAGFMPFLKSIQTTLMQRAHKSIKSKIQVLKDLRDNLLYEIDQRIQKLWYKKESSSEARGYKEDYHHMDFPSNEAALMTLGFLTLAVFLVKLVLKVIAAIKAKKAYYTTTTSTTTAATMTGRKKRDINQYDELDIDSTYRILSSIDKFPLKYGYN